MKRQHQRVGVFVDVQNMYYSARALYEQRVDFGEILKEAVGDRQLIRAFAYVIKADKEDEQTFFDALKERGFELRSKDLLTFYGGHQKGDWDVGISMDVVRLAPKLDVVVLVSGDGDFAELMKYVKAQGCRAEAIAFGSSASSQLREEVDQFVDLSEDTDRFLIPKRGKGKGGRPTKPAQQKPAQQPAQQPAPRTGRPAAPKASSPAKPAPRQRTQARPARKPAVKSSAKSATKRAPRITT